MRSKTIQLGIVVHGPLTIYSIVLFFTTETVGFGQHQWSDTFLYAGDKCTGHSAGSSVCGSISKPTWYAIPLAWLLLFVVFIIKAMLKRLCVRLSKFYLILHRLLWFSSDNSYTYKQMSTSHLKGLDGCGQF